MIGQPGSWSDRRTGNALRQAAARAAGARRLSGGDRANLALTLLVLLALGHETGTAEAHAKRLQRRLESGHHAAIGLASGVDDVHAPLPGRNTHVDSRVKVGSNDSLEDISGKTMVGRVQNLNAFNGQAVPGFRHQVDESAEKLEEHNKSAEARQRAQRVARQKKSRRGRSFFLFLFSLFAFFDHSHTRNFISWFFESHHPHALRGSA